MGRTITPEQSRAEHIVRQTHTYRHMLYKEDGIKHKPTPCLSQNTRIKAETTSVPFSRYSPCTCIRSRKTQNVNVSKSKLGKKRGYHRLIDGQPTIPSKQTKTPALSAVIESAPSSLCPFHLCCQARYQHCRRETFRRSNELRKKKEVIASKAPRRHCLQRTRRNP